MHTSDPEHQPAPFSPPGKEPCEAAPPGEGESARTEPIHLPATAEEHSTLAGAQDRSEELGAQPPQSGDDGLWAEPEYQAVLEPAAQEPLGRRPDAVADPAGTLAQEAVAPSPRGTHVAWALVERPAPEPALRGRHLAWARLEAPEVPVPPSPVPEVIAIETMPVQPTPVRVPAPARIQRSDETTGPTAAGRLAALIITFGLAWAIGLAVIVWLITVVAK